MDKLCILCRRNTTYDHADHCPECKYDLNKAESRGWNAAIDKAVEVVEWANNFLDALNQDEVWNLACRQADRKLRAVIEELKKLKEDI